MILPIFRKFWISFVSENKMMKNTLIFCDVRNVTVFFSISPYFRTAKISVVANWSTTEKPCKAASIRLLKYRQLKWSFCSDMKYFLVQLMENGVVTMTGLSVLLIVTEGSEPGLDTATTLFPVVMVQTVMERTWKLKSATTSSVQVIFWYIFVALAHLLWKSEN